MGGAVASGPELDELARFALRKNYRIVYAFYAGPVAEPALARFDVMVNDGVAETFVMLGGRLWKRDRGSASILVFPGLRATVRLDVRGQLAVGDLLGRPQAEGFGLAREAVLARAACKPGGVPVVSPVGNLLTVLDMQALSRTFAMAA